MSHALTVKIKTLLAEFQGTASIDWQESSSAQWSDISVRVEGDVIPGTMTSAGAPEASRRLSQHQAPQSRAHPRTMTSAGAPEASRRLSQHQAPQSRAHPRKLWWGSSTNCTDRKDWDDGRGNPCSHYQDPDKDLCSNYHRDWPIGVYKHYYGRPSLPPSGEVNFPDLHCCGCGRCQDTSSWTDGTGKTCDDYRKDFCHGDRYEGTTAAHLVNNPQMHCCGCGRCEDTPGYNLKNTPYNCDWYVDQEICVDGVFDESKLKQKANKDMHTANYPNMHCCACGKMYMLGGSTPAPPSPPVNVGDFTDVGLGSQREEVTMSRPSKVPTDPQGALEYLSTVHVAALEGGGVPVKITLTPLKWLES